jgi:beta-phosphoglucomutase
MIRQAVIFDMDGVLVDSEALIRAAAMQMFAEQGLQVKAADFTPFVGAGENRYLGGVALQYGLVLDIPVAKARTYALYLAMVAERLVVFPGALELVASCRTAGLRTAVASSADWIKIAANLEAMGLPVASWDAVVSGEDLEHLKPAPDLFLAAAGKLGVAPAVCTVIEDAVNGVTAAKAAGMYCIAVTTSFEKDDLLAADLVRDGLVDVTLADIMGDRDACQSNFPHTHAHTHILPRV